MNIRETNLFIIAIFRFLRHHPLSSLLSGRCGVSYGDICCIGLAKNFLTRSLFFPPLSPTLTTSANPHSHPSFLSVPFHSPSFIHYTLSPSTPSYILLLNNSILGLLWSTLIKWISFSLFLRDGSGGAIWHGKVITYFRSEKLKQNVAAKGSSRMHTVGGMDVEAFVHPCRQSDTCSL